MIKNFKDLEIWELGISLVEDIYRTTKKYPREEVYGLVSQMRRAAVSVPSNISEGFMRHHKKEFVQFLYVALGSCAEVETQLIVSQKMNFIIQKELGVSLETIDKLSRKIMSLIKKIKIQVNSR